MDLAINRANRFSGQESGASIPWTHDRKLTPVKPASAEDCIEICDCMIDIVSALFNVSGGELRRSGRTTIPVARVRQIAMYVTHCVLGLTMSDIGKGFGRDRTTVMYACHLIEDMRDDTEFDRIVTTVERIVIAAFRARFS